MELGADGPSNGQSSRISRGSNGAVTKCTCGTAKKCLTISSNVKAKSGRQRSSSSITTTSFFGASPSSGSVNFLSASRNCSIAARLPSSFFQNSPAAFSSSLLPASKPASTITPAISVAPAVPKARAILAAGFQSFEAAALAISYFIDAGGSAFNLSLMQPVKAMSGSSR